MFGTTTVPTEFISTHVILRKIKTYLWGKSIHYIHRPQLLREHCPLATRAAISRSPAIAPLRKVERLCPQTWVVVLFPQLGQFPPAHASVRQGEARRKRMQSTKRTGSENKYNFRNGSRLSTLLTVSTPAKSRISEWLSAHEDNVPR